MASPPANRSSRAPEFERRALLVMVATMGGAAVAATFRPCVAGRRRATEGRSREQGSSRDPHRRDQQQAWGQYVLEVESAPAAQAHALDHRDPSAPARSRERSIDGSGAGVRDGAGVTTCEGDGVHG
jgi:hypothetical protein